MKGDFSRLIHFDPRKQYSRVMEQQGRVQLDADWNEQVDILLRSLRTLAADLIGPFGAPANPDGTPGDGFRLVPNPKSDGTATPYDFVLLPGRYYVGGIACENLRPWIYGQNPGQLQLPKQEPNQPITFLLYLDVWERHVLYFQDEILREVALGGADTATRAQVLSRVRAVTQTADGTPLTPETTCPDVRWQWASWVEQWQPTERGKLKARARPGTPDDTDPCLSSPDARYRGENQLYRVEIHSGGIAAGAPAGVAVATFKWSRDNGSVVYRIANPIQLDKDAGTATVILESLGRDDRSALVQGDWVEVTDGEEDLRDGSDPLLQVTAIDPDRRAVTLKGGLPPDVPTPLLLRRWDHRGGKTTPNAVGVFPVQEGQWLDLEDGVQIFFDNTSKETYRAGDYWLIPARVATGDVEWPGPPDKPEALPPHGVEHRYAPLGIVTFEVSSVTLKDCRTKLGCRAMRLDTGVADWQLIAVSTPGTASPTPTPTPVEVSPPITATPAIAATPAAPAEAPQAANLNVQEIGKQITTISPATGGIVQSLLPRAASVVASPDPGWGLIPGAKWVSFSPQANGDANTTYKYQLSFDLCPCFHNAGISLKVLAASGADLHLNVNDKPLGGHIGSSKEPKTIVETAQARFLPGRNTLIVDVTSDGSPTGFVLSGIVDADGGMCC